MKYVPNVLSVSRIFLSISLLFFEPFLFLFMLMYVLAGVTDMIDGPIARKMKTASEFGASLDGAADIIFAFIVLYIAIPMLTIPFWLLLWIAALVFVRMLSLAIGYIRHKEFTMLHTYANKIAAVAMFAILIFYSLGVDLILILVVACSIVSIAHIEDIVINSTSKEPKRDIKGLFLFK
ncbi:MAG: CDP-alcohol phosphatidyltransferase family protein [Defluviitaleaceae bacterium]|nr:CDP-alcohol phosphatidyltransferase family protein [Defluviitaleaceae bacterium]